MDERVLRMPQTFMAETIPFDRHLGVRLTRLDDGFALMGLPCREEFIGDPFRPALHGGALGALADTCGAAHASWAGIARFRAAEIASARRPARADGARDHRARIRRPLSGISAVG